LYSIFYANLYGHFLYTHLYSHMSTLCRAIYPASDCGLGAAWSSSGDVCEQPSQWSDHLCWTDPPEQMVGTQWFCWHSVCYNFCTHPLSEQVFRRLLTVHLHFDALNVLRISNYNQYLIFPFRGAIAAGLYGYNGILVGLLMAVFSNAEDWYWWLLLPNIFMSMAW